jgi:hypothetical protein
VQSKHSGAPEGELPWAVSILPGHAFAPGVVSPQPPSAGPPQPAPVPMQPVPALGYSAGAQGSPVGASFDAHYAAPGQFGGPQLPSPQFGQPQQSQGQPQLAPRAQLGHGRRAHRQRAGTSRATVLLVVAVALALAGGGYYEAPKLLASKKAPRAAPVAHHASTTGAAVPGAGAGTATGGAKIGAGHTLPATVNGMPELTDQQSVAAAKAFLATTASTVFDFQENSSAALYRLNPTIDVSVAATANKNFNKNLANLDDAAAGFFMPGGSGMKATPVIGAASPAWIECSTFTNLGNAGAQDVNAKPATNCIYVSAAVMAAIVIPSPSGADQTTVAMAIGRELH